MKKILIRTNEIVNCWETKDACIVETRNGKKWVCKKTFVVDSNIGLCGEWNTLTFILSHKNQEFIVLELIEKGKSE